MTITPLMPVYGRCEVEPVRGDGCYLYDAQGREWLDFASGIAVNLLGHSHPHLVGAIQKQAATLMHTSNLYKVPAQAALAERLVALTFADTVFFTNSGAEAIECAIKTCRAFHYATGNPEKFRILTFANAFHGRTLATISATNQEKMRKGFEPLPDWFDVLPFNDLDAVKAAINPSIGGILVEPVQGEGGIRPATQEFLKGLRDLCDEHGLLLILDEVQCGVARTGTLFAHEQYGVTPDIMAIAKGIGGGFPVGACLATEDAAQGMVVGTHGSTYGGNPLAMAVGVASVEELVKPELMDNVREVSGYLNQQISGLKDRYPDVVLDIRGKGMLIGVQLGTPNREFMQHARDAHLLIAGGGDNCIRLLPPLNLTREEAREAIQRLEMACEAAQAKARSNKAGAA